ncbi:transcription factor E2FA-like [Primulina tabacum]|uniref:transcription factor E2FA-like n=1 Tax=Primulina tabacum TaxID=48773 RepID=UPI003F598C2E
MKERLRNLREDKNNKSWLRVNREDIINLPCFQNETLIAFKAPQGTRIQVPDPDEDGDFQERRYTLTLQSNKGAIDLWLVSPYEENPETTNPDGEAQPSILETSRANENASVPPLTQEVRGGISEADASSQEDLWTKLFDFRTDNNPGGYFLPLDTDLSIEAIRDLWAESEHDFNFLNGVQWLDTLVDNSTPPAQPPPSATAMPSISTTIAEIDCYCSESMRRIATSTSTPQEQTLPPISSATPSVLNMIADIDRYNLEMIDKDNVIASIRTPQSLTPPPINTAMPSTPNKIADIGGDSMNMIHDDNATPSINTTQAQPQPPIDTSLPSLPKR